jgi:hypothetical protein
MQAPCCTINAEGQQTFEADVTPVQNDLVRSMVWQYIIALSMCVCVCVYYNLYGSSEQ